MRKILQQHLMRVLLLTAIVVSSNAWGQATVPSTIHNLATGNFTLSSYSQTSFPTSMAIGKGAGDGTFTTDLTENALNGGSAGQWNGEGANGISYMANGDFRRASFLLRLTSANRQSVNVVWKVRDISTASNVNNIHLQWRSGASGAWNNVTGDEYTQGTTASGTEFNVTLPSGANNLADLRIRWIYYETGSGTRDRLAIDDITVSSTAIAPAATFNGTLSESSLNSATFAVDLSNATYVATPTFAASGFSLNNAPAGLSIASVVRTSSTKATITLAYNNSDFDTSITNFSVGIAANQLSTGEALTSSTGTLTAVIETLTPGGALTYSTTQCLDTSADQNFTLTGSNLKSGDITLSCPLSAYTFSTTANGQFTNPLSVSQTGGTFSQVIYVRLTASEAISYNSTITISGGAADTVTKTVTGTGSAPVSQAVTTNAVGTLATTSAVLNGNFTTKGVCPATTEKGFVYSVTSANSDPLYSGSGVLSVSSTSVASTGTYSISATSLTPGTNYTYKAYVYNGSTYTYGTAVSFTTPTPPPAATFNGTGITEANLSGATFAIDIANTTYAATLSISGFTLNNAPLGVSIQSVVRTSDTKATITLSYNDSDFDTTVTTFSVTVAADQLTTGAALTSSNGTITAVIEQLTSSGTLAFGATGCIGATTSQSFTLNLTSVRAGDITVASNNTQFTVSANNVPGSFSNTATFSQAGGTSTKTIYVQLTSTAASPAATLTFTGGTANNSTNTKSATATAVNTVATVTTTAPGNITGTGATFAGNVSNAGCSTTTRGIVYSSTINTPSITNGAILLTDTATGTGTYSFNLTNLTPNTTYNVRAYATNNGGTTYGSTLTFSTPCAAFSLPFTENFEAATFPPSCWAKFAGTNGAGTEAEWIRTTTTTYGASAGSAYASYDSSPTNGELAEDWLVTPGLVIPNAGLPVKLRFFERQQFTDPTNYYIKISTASQSTIASFTDLAAYNQSNLTTEYSERVIDLTAYAGQTVYIAFVMSQDNGSSWYVDNVSVKEEINAPVATAATNISPTSFVANWNAYALATSYSLDVTDAPLGFSEIALNEGFEAVTFPAAGWLNTGWTRSTTSSDISTGEAAATSEAFTGTLTTSAIYKPNQLKFNLGRSNNTNAKTLTVEVSTTSQTSGFNTIATYTNNNVASASYDQYTIDLSAYSNSETVYIRFVKASSTTSPWRLDNILVTKATGYLSGYQNLAVSGTSQVVSGLTQGKIYHYRVRAINTTYNLTSGNSNIIAATTGRNITWKNNTSNVAYWDPAAPSASGIDAATIEVPYNTTTTGSFSVASLTVSNALTITEGKTVTVANALTNNGTIEVQNNGALVQTGTLANANGGSGSATVIRHSNPLKKLDYTLWGAPVTSQNLKTFSQNTVNSRFYTYGWAGGTATTEVYQAVSDPVTTPFTPGKGYLIRMPDFITPAEATASGTTPEAYTAGTGAHTVKGTFTGTLNNGEVPVSITIGGVSQAGHYIALGNPYPSPISIKKFFEDNAGVLNQDSGIYFWRKTNSATTATNSYAHLTLMGFVAQNTDNDMGGANGGSFYYSPYNEGSSATSFNQDWIISPGQGFLVKVKSAPTAQQVVFNNTMRHAAPAANGQPFFKTANQDEQPTAISRLWLNLSNTNNAFAQSMIGYMEGTTLGLDYGYDARLLADGSAKLYSKAAESNLAIQARPQFVPTDVVPMGFTAGTAGQYTITLDHVDGVFSTGQNVYLKDNLLGSTTNLNTTPYQFTTDAGTFDTRFEVVYLPGEAMGEQTPDLANSVIVYQQNGAININSGNIEMTGVTLYDIRGRKLYEKNGINATQTSITGLTIAKEVVIVEITTVSDKVSRKIVY